MTLSNTTTPTHYAKFREKVLKGEILINEEIEMQMNRIDSLVANPNYYYDANAIDGFIKFCESEMVLTDGSEIVLLDSFKLWAEDLLSWFYFVERSVYIPSKDNRGGHYVTKKVKKRLRVKQYLIVARGAAKSMYAMLLQAYFLSVSSKTTHQITMAPTMKQAEEVMSPFRTALTRSIGPLFKFLTAGSILNTTGSSANRKKLASTKKGIENYLTGSLLEIRPMTITKLQGLRPFLSTIDEWLSVDIKEDVIGAIEQGASKLDDYIIIALSSEGVFRNGVGDTIKIELMDILKGDYLADHISIFHYKLDTVEEVADPRTWIKAQPNLGITVSYETYHQDVERMEKAPSTRNDILAKRFGIPMEGFTYFFTYEETLPHRVQNFQGMACSLGADLSQGDDFCAFSFLFPLRDGTFGVKTRSYISEITMQKLPSAPRQKYEEFLKEGTLIVMEGTTILDMEDVYRNLDQHIIDNRYDVRCLGYDPYNAKEFVASYERDYGSYNIVKVIQGSRTESVPLGEMKKLSEQRLLVFDEKLMMYAMGNAVVKEDINGNRQLVKTRHDAKIDNVASTMDALVAYKVSKEVF